MTKQYIAQGNIMHDQEPYKAGDKIMLEDAQAKPLEDLGYVKLDETQSTVTPQANPAIGLDPASPNNMTSQQTGQPMTATPTSTQVGPSEQLPSTTATTQTQPAASVAQTPPAQPSAAQIAADAAAAGAKTDL